MRILSNNELYLIEGGVSLTGALLSALKGVYSTVASIGEQMGSAFRRIKSGQLCSCR